MNEPAPEHLKAKGSTLWEQVTSKYELRPDELVILEAACGEVDLIAKLREVVDELDAKSLTVTGSHKQEVAHPLISEMRQHRSTLKSLLGSLHLPDESGRESATRSDQARKAAEARWRRAG